MGDFAAVVELADLTAEQGLRIEAPVTRLELGRSVTGLGDVNGDGYDDFMIGAPIGDPGGVANAGLVYVVFGTGNGFPGGIDLGALDGTNGFVIAGAGTEARLGESLGARGDFNGDGYDDIVVGAYKVDGGYGGAAYVIFGKADFDASLNLADLDGSNGIRFTGAGDQVAGAALGSGDFNGDGLMDLIIGSKWASPHGTHSGAAYVVFGTTDGLPATTALSTLDGSNGFILKGAAQNNRAGYAVAGVGDINGDGYDDMVVGVPYDSPHGSESGSAYVVFGHSSTGGASGFAAGLDLASLTGADGFKISGASSSNELGWSVAAAGDVNGDGYDDVLVGAYRASPHGGLSGAAYVIFGHASTGGAGGFAANIDVTSLNGANGFKISGVTVNNFTGRALASLDINADGYADVVVSADAADVSGSDAGAAYVVYGKASGFAANIDLSTLDGTNGFRIDGEHASDHLGLGLSNAGDLNGDGVDDLLLGATLLKQSGVDAGAAYILYSRAHNDFTGGGANDVQDGSAIRDIMNGGDGDDLLNGLAANDVLSGEGGNDQLDGGAGADAMAGGAGFDIYYVDNPGDTTVEQAEEGDDLVYAGVSWTLADNVEDLVLDTGALNGTGNALANDISGNDAANILDGREGADTLWGGAGNDIYYVDDPGDRTREFSDSEGPQGVDTVHSTISWTLADRIERLVLEEVGAIDGTGNALGNWIFGNSSANRLDGAAGIDTLWGGAGDDTLIGGIGNDILNGEADDDDLQGGDGADKLNGGDGADQLDGGAGADQMSGGAGDDVLIGGADNDNLDGGAGADAMTGGAGNDVYYVDDGGDTTVELAGGGTDIVRAAMNWVLGANVEQLELQGSAEMDGTGNELANRLTGNDGDNVLSGLAGVDTILAGGGNDHIVGGAGNDLMTGGSGGDAFVVLQESVYSSRAPAGRALEIDFVYDLNRAEGDWLDLSAIDANTATAEDDAFTLVGAFGRHAGEMTLAYSASTNQTVLSLDADGDGKADYQMKITGDVRLDSGDWLL